MQRTTTQALHPLLLGALLIVLGCNHTDRTTTPIAAEAPRIIAMLIDPAVPFPTISNRGYVSLGTPRATGETSDGLLVYRITVKGYLPDLGTFQTNVNGIAQNYLLAISIMGRIIRFGGFCDIASNQRTPITAFVNRSVAICTELYIDQPIKHVINIYNPSDDPKSVAFPFEMYIDYTDK